MSSSAPVQVRPRARRLFWQRVPVSEMRIDRPGKEALLLIAYSTFYVLLSGGVGWIIRTHPLYAGVSWSFDPAYILFKVVALLLVPIMIFHRLGYGACDLLPGWRADRRQVSIAALCFVVGLLVNNWHLRGIAKAAAGYSGGEFAVRVALGVVLPLFMAGLPEEIMYRGLLQTRLEAVMGRFFGLLVSALLFTAWHLPSRYLLANGVEGKAGDLGSVLMGTGLPVFVAALVFGFFWDRYRRLVPLIAAHWGVDVLPSISGLLGIRF